MVFALFGVLPSAVPHFPSTDIGELLEMKPEKMHQGRAVRMEWEAAMQGGNKPNWFDDIQNYFCCLWWICVSPVCHTPCHFVCIHLDDALDWHA